MKTLVEGMLPARFFTQYGVYLQTCAHIEHACWTIYRLADPKARAIEGKDDYSLVKSKGSTQGLLKKLKASSKYCSPPLQIRILTAHQKINEGLEARNTATHGAWFFDNRTRDLKVEHYFIRKSDPPGTWRFYEEPISQNDIDEALENADLILRELISIRSDLEASHSQIRPASAYP
jgi:hypothetical protein